MPTSKFRCAIKVKPKGRPRFNGRIAYTDKATRDFEQDVKTTLMSLYKAKPLTGPLSVELEIFFQAPKKTAFSYPPRGDCDNLFKSVADAANEILWEDDSQIVEMKCSKKWSDSDYFILTVSELDLK